MTWPKDLIVDIKSDTVGMETKIVHFLVARDCFYFQSHFRQCDLLLPSKIQSWFNIEDTSFFSLQDFIWNFLGKGPK